MRNCGVLKIRSIPVIPHFHVFILFSLSKRAMFKRILDQVWAFDVEWIPDPASGRVLYKLPETASDEEVIRVMWEKGGATRDDPMPYIKTVLCRVVSISTVVRTVKKDEGTKLHLLSLPRDIGDTEQTAEANILKTFLDAIGRSKPQLVGFNSISADLKILIQRAVANGIRSPEFCTRPDKPWEGPDYFARGSEWNIDLMEIVGGWGKSTPSLNEMVTVCGIPGKIRHAGHEVAPLWLDGELDKIIAYNEFDALATYLLWLRLAHFGGLLSPEQFEVEQLLLQDMLQGESEKAHRAHLKDFLMEWEKLRPENHKRT